jgi:two-component sensor histidine kinase
VITVALAAAEEGHVLLTVGDDAIGLPADFDLATAKSLGLRLLPLLAEQLHGTLAVEKQAGCLFALHFPTDDLPEEQMP